MRRKRSNDTVGDSLEVWEVYDTSAGWALLGQVSGIRGMAEEKAKKLAGGRKFTLMPLQQEESR